MGRSVAPANEKSADGCTAMLARLMNVELEGEGQTLMMLMEREAFIEDESLLRLGSRANASGTRG